MRPSFEDFLSDLVESLITYGMLFLALVVILGVCALAGLFWVMLYDLLFVL